MDNIVIVNYGLGNLQSIVNNLKRSRIHSTISSEIDVINAADKLILPGVGHFANGMKNLNDMGLIELLNKKVLIDKTPILGICLGMQLFTRHSEEGDVAGFGWIDAETIKFKLNGRLKIPHMGWNEISIKKNSALLNGISQQGIFYFVHSYHVSCNDQNDILSTTNYGIEFVSSIQKENIFATQFHPEKSHEFGSHILKNFVEKA